jgi:uncharacterized membrane protein (DUF4010 family)
MNGFSLPTDVERLMAALAVGLLIGLERGWSEREAHDGSRVAGLRTFALTGLLGGVMGLLQPAMGVWPLVAAELGLSLLMGVAYFRTAEQSGKLSATTALAMLLTLALGAFCVLGHVALALAAAVVTAVLLNLKPTLHSWLRLIQESELSASLQLLVLSVVVLPYLPDVGMGPYQALNPYKLWWAVILISGLSLTGHFAMRLSGSRRGILWTGLLGGLASSTATTLALGRFAKEQPVAWQACSAGIQAACGVMFLRMVVLLGVVSPSAVLTLGIPLGVAGLVLLVWALWQWRRSGDVGARGVVVPPMTPFNLGTALGFAAFLAVVAVLVPAARQWLGAGGIYMLSAASGLADVDAIVISLSRMHHSGDIALLTAGVGIGLASLSNSATKSFLAWSAGGWRIGWRVAAANVLACGGAVLAWLVL